MSESDDPEWLPDEYDRDADLADRLPIMAEIDGGIEVWGGDERGHSTILGEPHRVEENARGTLILYAGGSEFNWSYEVYVPASDAEPRVESVNPDQDVEAYQRTKDTVLRDADVRIYGIDHDRLEDTEVPA